MTIFCVTLQNVLGLSLYVIATLGQNTEEFAVRSATSLCLDLGRGRAASKYAVGSLPNVNFDLPASWAGQISVPNTAKNELFFWLFEAQVAGQCDDLISRCLLATGKIGINQSFPSLAQRWTRLLFTRWTDEREWANLLPRERINAYIKS